MERVKRVFIFDVHRTLFWGKDWHRCGPTGLQITAKGMHRALCEQHAILDPFSLVAKVTAETTVFPDTGLPQIRTQFKNSRNELKQTLFQLHMAECSVLYPNLLFVPCARMPPQWWVVMVTLTYCWALCVYCAFAVPVQKRPQNTSNALKSNLNSPNKATQKCVSHCESRRVQQMIVCKVPGLTLARRHPIAMTTDSPFHSRILPSFPPFVRSQSPTGMNIILPQSFWWGWGGGG